MNPPEKGPERGFFQTGKRCGRLYIAHVEGNEEEKSYRTTAMSWYNRPKKLRQLPGMEPGKLAELEEAFRKSQGNGEKDMGAFAAWFDRLIEGDGSGNP